MGKAFRTWWRRLRKEWEWLFGQSQPKPMSKFHHRVLSWSYSGMSLVAKVKLSWTPCSDPKITEQRIQVTVGEVAGDVKALPPTLGELVLDGVPASSHLHVRGTTYNGSMESDARVFDFDLGDLSKPLAMDGFSVNVMEVTDTAIPPVPVDPNAPASPPA